MFNTCIYAELRYNQVQCILSSQFLEIDRWAGMIKDYDGGTLMECKIRTKNWLSKSERDGCAAETGVKR